MSTIEEQLPKELTTKGIGNNDRRFFAHNCQLFDFTEIAVTDKTNAEYDSLVKGLTRRQRQILRLMQNGFKSPEVARKLGLTNREMRNEWRTLRTVMQRRIQLSRIT